MSWSHFLLIPVADALPAVQAHLEHGPGDDPPSPDELAELVALTVLLCAGERGVAVVCGVSR